MDIYADKHYAAVIYVHSEDKKEIARIPFMAEWPNEEDFDQAFAKVVKALKEAYYFWPADGEGDHLHIRVVRQDTYVNLV